jgi:hypothetical protein
MKNFQKEPMPKKKLHPIAGQFSDDEMDQIKRYGQALGGSPTSFDEEVERRLADHYPREFSEGELPDEEEQ